MPLKIISAACAATLAVGVAACGGDDTTAPVKPTAKPTTELTGLAGQGLSVDLDRNFLTSLDTFGITPTGTGGATTTTKTTRDDSQITFPVNSGEIAYYTPKNQEPYLKGQALAHGSGLSLTKGQTVVEVSNFAIDPGQALVKGVLTVNGKVVSSSLPLFQLNGKVLHPLQYDADTQTASLPSSSFKLTPQLSRQLNQAFHTTGFIPNWLAGEATLSLQAS